MSPPLLKHKNYAELWVASLLTHIAWQANQHPQPHIENLSIKIADERILSVVVTPTSLISLITECAKLPEFKRKQRTNLTVFEQDARKQREYVCLRDSIATAGLYGVIREPKRDTSSSVERKFLLPLRYDPTLIDKHTENLAWLFEQGGIWDKGKAEIRKKNTPQKNLQHSLHSISAFEEAFAKATADVGQLLPKRINHLTATDLDSLEKLLPAFHGIASLNSPYQSSLLLICARIHIDRGDLNRALSLLEQCINLNPNALEKAETLHHMGIIYHRWGNYARAEEYYINGLNQRTAHFGERHSDVGDSIHALGNLYYELGLYVEAETKFNQALTIQKGIHGNSHSSVANVLNSLAALYTAIGQVGKAENFYQKALSILQRVSNPYPYISATQYGLANIYIYQGDYEEAKKLHREAIEGLEEYHKPNHPSLAICKAGLAAVHEACGETERAMEIYSDCINLLIETYGNEHPKVATYSIDLARLITQEFNEIYRLQQALKLFQRSIRILSKTLNSSHPSLINAHKGLDFLREKLAANEKLLS